MIKRTEMALACQTEHKQLLRTKDHTADYVVGNRQHRSVIAFCFSFILVCIALGSLCDEKHIFANMCREIKRKKKTI